MPGHMQQRGSSTWRLHAFAGKDSNGRKQYTSKTFHGSKKEAGIALAAFVTDVCQGEDRFIAGGGDHGLADAEQMAGLEEGSALPRHHRPISSGDQARRTCPWLNASLPTAAAPHRGPLQRARGRGQSGSSIRKIHWALRQSLAWAHRRGYVSIIATDGIELPPLGAREMEPPSSDDVRTVIEYLLATDPDWGTLVAVIAWTGCRRGEVAGLRWEDVDFKQGNLLIRRSVAAVPGEARSKGPRQATSVASLSVRRRRSS